MGRKKWRSFRKLEVRKRHLRTSPPQILIVCEGEKTEPVYFSKIKQSLQLPMIEVDNRQSGNDPLRLAQHALERYCGDGKIYDRVYCVFDRDAHSRFDDAVTFLDKTTEEYKTCAGPDETPTTFIPITSDPCFELWLLLHFQYTDKQPCAGTAKSKCKQIEKELGRILKQKWQKHLDIFSNKTPVEIKNLLREAIKNSKRLKGKIKAIGRSCPVTNLHDLAEYILELTERPTPR